MNSLNGTFVNDQRVVNRSIALSELDLRGSKVTERGLDLVAKTCGSRLLSLDLSQCVRLLSDAGVVALLGGCPRLTRLDLSHCRFTDVAIEAAAQSCPALTSLDYSWNGSGMGDGAAQAVAAHCPRLQASAHRAARRVEV